MNLKERYTTEGIVLIAIGLCGLLAPRLLSFSIELLVAIACIAVATVQLYRWSTSPPNAPERTTALLLSLIYGAIGIPLILFPLRGLETLSLMLILLFSAGGVLQIFSAFLWRAILPPFWGLLSGALSLSAVWVIWLRWPASGLWLLGILAGLQMMALGTVRLMIGLQHKE